MKKRNIRKTNSKKLYLFGFLVLVGVVFYTIKFVNLGSKLGMLEEEESKMVMENKKLTSTLIDGSSLIKVEETAIIDGFIKPQKIVYITDDNKTFANLRK